jgi:hypothetical protein
MATITYMMVEGETKSDEDIESFIEIVRTSLKTRFSPRKVQIIIQDILPDDMSLLLDENPQIPQTPSDKVSGYS